MQCLKLTRCYNHFRLQKEIPLIDKEKNSNCRKKMGKGHGQANNRRETQEVNKYMTGCLKSLI